MPTEIWPLTDPNPAVMDLVADELAARAAKLEVAIRRAIEECDSFESRSTIRTGLALALEDDTDA